MPISDIAKGFRILAVRAATASNQRLLPPAAACVVLIRLGLNPLGSSARAQFDVGIGAQREPRIAVDPNNNLFLVMAVATKPASAHTPGSQIFFTESTDGGATWTAGKKIAGPMNVGWLPVSDAGPMVADYIGVSYSNGNPFGVFAGAQAPSGTTLNEAMYTTKNPLPVDYDAPRFSSVDDQPVANAHSDHPMKFFYDDEGHREIPRSRWVTNTEAH